MEKIFKQLLQNIGENVDREGLRKTPERADRAFRELTKGYHENVDQIINNAIFKSNCDEMIIVKNIEIYSLCEHHLLPFIGKCHVGYIPNGKIIGLSKIARIVDVYARRLQIQENLTREIAMALKKYVSGDVGVMNYPAASCEVSQPVPGLVIKIRSVDRDESVDRSFPVLGHTS